MLRREDPGGALQRRPMGAMGRFQGWDPWRDFDEMNRQMSELFNWALGGIPRERGRGQEMTSFMESVEPEIDLFETESEYTIKAALPGVDPNDIHIDATENTIQMFAETRNEFAEGRWNRQQTQPGGGTQTGSQAASGTQAAACAQGAGGQTSGTQTTQEGGQHAIDEHGAELQKPAMRHRQSRYSSVSHFQFAYTLPEEIDPGRISADFRNGMLELRLPKREQRASKSVRVPVRVTGGQTTTSTGVGEAGPGAKMGQSYTPSAGEDFTNQPQGPRERAESGEPHRRSGESSSSGETGVHTPAEAKTGGTSGANPADQRK